MVEGSNPSGSVFFDLFSEENGEETLEIKGQNPLADRRFCRMRQRVYADGGGIMSRDNETGCAGTVGNGWQHYSAGAIKTGRTEKRGGHIRKVVLVVRDFKDEFIDLYEIVVHGGRWRVYQVIC